MNIETEKWSPEKVCRVFDSNWNLTLAKLSNMSGHTIAELKWILMGDESN